MLFSLLLLLFHYIIICDDETQTQQYLIDVVLTRRPRDRQKTGTPQKPKVA